MQLYIDKSMLLVQFDCAILWDQAYCNLATVVGLHGESRKVINKCQGYMEDRFIH